MKVQRGFEEKSRLGRLLINRGYLTEAELEEALTQQRTSGQRLGEVLVASGCISEKDLVRVLKHQSRYRNTAAFVTMVALPFQPLVSFASTTDKEDADAVASAGQLYEGHGFSPLTDDEMSSVSGQRNIGLLDRIEKVAAMPEKAADADGGSADEIGLDAVEGVRLAANVFVPVLSFLDSDLTISGVKYREGEERYSIRDDGALSLALPERIEEIRMDNIRVAGGNGASMGSVSIQDIRFHTASSMTIYTR
ncbi:pilus assembly protein PilB [Marinobacter litoralis]|uniref:pilus assembly protein PilB n=1 Tax=Marinobacter litoralis TaxID=187981 RepID=UPI0018EAB783|nr:pilus assembly protein PilB [Marinobacter litoralis]MBJ6138006.1 pilus assembly protein PilB [Marinobacter litoralis]